jgi:hypothetical protein
MTVPPRIGARQVMRDRRECQEHPTPPGPAERWMTRQLRRLAALDRRKT